MANNSGQSTCKFCGATYKLFSISNRDMQGLTKAWKRKHERVCEKRTPKQRLAWAKKYIGLSYMDSAITVEVDHQGFILTESN